MKLECTKCSCGTCSKVQGCKLDDHEICKDCSKEIICWVEPYIMELVDKLTKDFKLKIKG